MPRRTLSATEQARILSTFREGGSLRQAADCAGVPRSTLSDLLHRGAAGHRSDEARFVRECWRAKGDRALDALKVVRKRLTNWQAAAWYLERSDPNTFALHRRPAVEVSSTPDEARKVTIYLPDNGRGNHTNPDTERQKHGDEL